MNNAKDLSRELFKEAKTQTAVVNATNGTNLTNSTTSLSEHSHHHKKEHSLLGAERDIVIKDSHKKVEVPQAMDATMNKPAESLPVYT
jgi:hypothetical protein